MSQEKKPYVIWEVSGSFIIPGTREKGSFGPIRVVAQDRFKASEDLVAPLTEQFRKKLRNGAYFTKHFASMHLKWTPFVPKTA